MTFEGDPTFQGMPPIDRMHKLRRAILQTINDARQGAGSAPLHMDVIGNQAAC